MSDYHEMFEEWMDLGYDPAYVGEDHTRKQENNEPVDPDSWSDDDITGG